VHSATRSEISSLTFGAPGRGLGIRFLLVFLFDTMVHIAEHRDETSEDFPVEEEAASFTPQSSGHPALGVAAVCPARQCRRPGLHQGLLPPERSLRPESCCATRQALRPHQGL
jgi:hypothetical protein